MSLAPWSLTNKRFGDGGEQPSKKHATGSEKFLLKGMQVCQSWRSRMPWK